MTQVNDSRGVQAVDNNVQLNLFVGQAPAGPVVAGGVPQAPPAFQPRDDLMAQLRANGPGVSVVRAVTGLRGVGKTQLAAAYARERIDDGWRLVAWVNAEDTPSMLADLEVVASRLGIDRPGTALETIATEVRNRVEADGERCLLVFDNVTDPGALRPYLPAAGKSQVIVTSTQASVLALGRPTEVEVFTESEAREFLADRTGLRDPVGADLLAAELGCLPLALTQAAAVIKFRHLTYDVYLSRLRAYPAERYLPPAQGDPYPHGVAESILLSLDTVTAADPTGRCADLLAVISLLSSDGVPRELLYQGAWVIVYGPCPEETVDEALAGLASASLLTFVGHDETNLTVTAHRLVMRVIRERLGQDGTLTDIGVKTALLLKIATMSQEEPWRQRPAARDLVQHVIAFNDHLLPHLGPDDRLLTEALLRSQQWAQWCLHVLGDDVPQAIDLGETLLPNMERVLGAMHTETLTLRNNLADSYRSTGRLGEAVALFERTLADWVRVHGEDHPDTLSVQSNLAAAYQDERRLREAVALYERTLAKQVRVLGQEHPYVLASRNNLAIAYEEAGRLDEAIPLYEQAAAGVQRTLGPDHPYTVIARENLAHARERAVLSPELSER